MVTVGCPHADPAVRDCAGCPSIEDGERWCEGEISGRPVEGWGGGIGVEIDRQTCACTLTEAQLEQARDELAERVLVD